MSLQISPQWRESICNVGDWASLVAQLVKNPPAMLENVGSIPGSGRSPREGNGKPLQYSCLGNHMDSGDWWAVVHGVTKSRT